MRLPAKLVSAWRSWFDRPRLDRELDAEIRAYVEELVERKVSAGESLEVARRQALVEVGCAMHIKEDVRAGRIGAGIEVLVRDARFAVRGLRRTPGFTAAAVATLALGIGANTAIFSVVNALLVAPLPYQDSSRLVFVWSDMTSLGYPRAPLSGPELNDLRERTTVFQSFGAIWSNTAALTGDGDPEQLRIGLVSSNFFSVLGAPPAIGRTFGAEDELTGGPGAIILSWPVWQRRYGGDRTIVGRKILVNGQPLTVVGVMPERFKLLMPPDAAVPDDTQAWLPFNRQFIRGPRGQQYLRVVGRMRDGITLEQARREIDSVADQISREFSEYGAAGRRFTTVGLQEDGVRELRPTLLALFAAVGILLVIACVNVAGLMVARAAARSRETAVRAALGASRRRLLAYSLVEGLVLTALGAAAGILVAKLALPPILALRPPSVERIASATIDARVLLFTSLIAFGWGALLSCAPASELMRADVLTALQAGSSGVLQARGHGGGALSQRTRGALVVLQIALGVVLLVGAGLLLRSFLRVQSVDPGFRVDDALTFKIALPASRYRGREAVNAFSRRLQDELSALPGVRSVGAISHLPFDNLPNWGGPYLTTTSESSGRGGDDASAPHADLRTVTPGLFETIGASLVEGRYFSEDDDPRRQLVAVVDDLLASRAWPGASAIGRQVLLDPGSTGHASVPATVVGVVRHLRNRSLVDPLSEQIYLPQRMVNRSPVSYVLRASVSPAELTAAVQRTIARLDPQLPVYDVRPFAAFVESARATQRFSSLLAGAFAAVAVLLACVGVYGVMAYALARRRYEFGVRLALGAEPRQLTRLVLREGIRLTLAGSILGTVGAVIAAHAIASQLYGVTPGDLTAYAGALLLIQLAAMSASWLPARRAAAADPLDLLRVA